QSTFQGLGVTWRHDASRQIKINSEKVVVDLQQTDRFLRSFKAMQSHLAKLQSMRGQIELQKLTLAGPYDDPAEWNFASTGTLDRIEIRHADFSNSIILSHGRFAAQPGRIRFFDTAATMSDSNLV